jgi:hypothetical protein
MILSECPSRRIQNWRRDNPDKKQDTFEQVTICRTAININGSGNEFGPHSVIAQDEWTANARLIAAAPDLLAACEAALEGVGEDEKCWADHHGLCQAHNLEPIDECWVGKCRAAIAKAKGE